ncbi:MAG: DUF937 domain-containing protein [Candidatus Saccharibacteria bacterium]
MENLLNTILSHVDNQSLQSMSQNANTSPDQAKHALSNAIPILMNAMAKNSRDPQGAASLQQAVQKDHDGSILDNLGSFFSNPDSANGSGILKHILGPKQQDAAEYISKDSGVSESSAHKILEYAAPLVMGFLGRNSAGGGMGIGNLLNSFINTHKQEDPQKQSFISKLLDMDHDGDILDDLKEKGQSLLGNFMK